MKKFYLFACCILFTMAIIAQPALQYPQNAPEVGDVMEIQFVSPDGLSHEPSGADVSWDFSQLINWGDLGQITAISPASAPAGNEFPTANVVMNMGDTIFTYALVEENGAYYLGSQATTGTYPTLFIYSDSRKYMEYPFTYNDVFSDTYKGVSIVSVAEVRLTATTSVLADSYGTLILPTGTFTDVLRTTTIDNEIDSIFIGGSFTSVVNVTRTQYAWYAPTSVGPLLSMEILDHSGELNTICYYTNAGTGINTPDINYISHFNIYPNPAEDNLFVEYKSSGNLPVTILIVNQVGQVMISSDIRGNASGLVTEKVDIRNLPAGIYFANISYNSNSQKTKKFVIR